MLPNSLQIELTKEQYDTLTLLIDKTLVWSEDRYAGLPTFMFTMRLASSAQVNTISKRRFTIMLNDPGTITSLRFDGEHYYMYLPLE